MFAVISLSEAEMLAQIEAALPQVTPTVTEWGLVQDLVTETSAKMGNIEALIKMTGKLDMDNDSVTSLELTHTIPSNEVNFSLSIFKVKQHFQ